MRLLLDEMLSPEIARALRNRGHDVQAVGERREWVGLSDADVLRLARRERRAVVTNNLRDFRPLHAAALAAGERHFGMVFVPATLRRTRRDVGPIVKALEQLLATHPGDEDLADGEAWL